MDSEAIKKYTELPFALQILRTQKLVMVSPKKWDDQNDAFAINEYRRRGRHGSVLALCVTKAAQTHHHWRVFTHGASGACIHFHPEQFYLWAESQPGVMLKDVIYKSIGELSPSSIPLHQLPFIKRAAYEPENELRLIYSSPTKSLNTHALPFEASMIRRVVLNPWLPQPTVETLKELVASIPGCERIPVIRATIVESKEWQSKLKYAAA